MHHIFLFWFLLFMKVLLSCISKDLPGKHCYIRYKIKNTFANSHTIVFISMAEKSIFLICCFWIYASFDV